MNRRHFIGLAAAAIAQCAVGGQAGFGQGTTQPAGTGGSKVILNGVDRYQVVEPMFEGIRVVLAHRGERYSPAYIQGISGAAFRIAGICPCAPTCSTAMSPQELLTLLGYEFCHFPLSGNGMDPTMRVREMIPKVQDEIRAGRAVLVWHAFTNAEWDVVCGFDDEQNIFLGRGSYVGRDEYAKALQGRAKDAVRICPAFGALFVGNKTGQFDARRAEVAALREAVRHAHDQRNVDKLGGEKWCMLEGIRCYERWVSDFKSPEKKRTAGDSYCHGIYRSTHRTAGPFLSEIAPKYPQAGEPLLAAARHFAAEADLLDKGQTLLGWDSPEGPDADRNRQAAELLGKACEQYKLAIGQVEAALNAAS